MADVAEASSSGSQAVTATPNKKSDRLARLRDLQLRRNEARKMNHQEVVEEDRKAKLPANFEAKRKRTEWEDQQEEYRKECEERGEDYERVKLLEVGADEAEKWDKKKRNKANPDQGFADFEQATQRQYQRLTKQIKPDMVMYKEEKKELGESFYPTVDTIGVVEHKDSEQAIDKMVVDLEKQIEKRAKYSRRRAYDPDGDIDYINERNMKFNQKLERFYGKYTTEIKQNLERGTAV